jgi:hypothetical protein
MFIRYMQCKRALLIPSYIAGGFNASSHTSCPIAEADGTR